MSAAEPPDAAPPAVALTAWAPLRHATFRMLWLTWLASNACMWMNDVAAAWLMTSLTTSPVLIALVQSAATLPVFLLGLPSGALSWGLFQDTERSGRFVEYFLDESWADHLRRFERFTAADPDLRERRHAFHIGVEPPKVTRYLAEAIDR